jgi:hypothetical protein
MLVGSSFSEGEGRCRSLPAVEAGQMGEVTSPSSQIRSLYDNRTMAEIPADRSPEVG